MMRSLIYTLELDQGCTNFCAHLCYRLNSCNIITVTDFNCVTCVTQTSFISIFTSGLRYIQAATSPKDIIIVVDTSGSMKGLRLTIAKHTINTSLDTLGENDFVNVIAVSTQYRQHCGGAARLLRISGDLMTIEHQTHNTLYITIIINDLSLSLSLSPSVSRSLSLSLSLSFSQH